MDLELLPQGADQVGEDAAACPQVTALAIGPALPEGSWLPPHGAGKSSFFRTAGFRENQWRSEKNPRGFSICATSISHLAEIGHIFKLFLYTTYL